MSTKTKYRILAVIICVVIYVIYLAIAMSLGWKHGGGVLILAILFGVVSWVWKKAGEMADKADAQKRVTNQQNVSVGEEDKPTFEPSSMEEEVLPPLPEEHIVEANIDEEIVTTPPEIKPAIQLELNGVLKALFVLWVIVAGVQSIIQFASNEEGSYAFGAFDFAFTFLGIVGILGMYTKKRWGLFVAGIFFVLQFIFCLIIGRIDSSFYEEAFKVIVRVIVLCGLLFIRKNGHSAWETIWNNGVLNSAEPLADGCSVEECKDVDLPPIPEGKEEKAEVTESVVDSSKCISEKTASPCDTVSAEPIEETSHSNKYRWIYLITALVLALITIGGVFLVRSIKEQKVQKIMLERQQKFNELVSKGIEAHSNDLDDLAMKYLSEAQSLDSSNWELYYYRGKIALENNKDVLSSELLGNAYNLNSQKTDGILGSVPIAYADLLYDYSTALWRIVEYDTSKVIAQEYYSLYPNDIKAYHRMVYAEVSADNLAKAHRWAKKMMENFPNNADSYFCYAYVLAKEQSYSTAIAYYKKSLEIDPEDSGAYNNMGVCYSKMGDKSNAKKCYKIAVAIDGNETAANNLQQFNN